MKEFREESSGAQVELLLPWYAAGTLSAADARRVEAALASSAVLRRNLHEVEEEWAETVRCNEMLSPPSARASQALFRKIEAEVGSQRRREAWGLSRLWAGATVRSFPGLWGYVGALAALVLVVQTGLLTRFYLEDRNEVSYRDVDVAVSRRASAQGSFGLIRFVPEASAAEITAFLLDNNMALVNGPLAGGLYRIQLASTRIGKDQLTALARNLRQNRRLVSLLEPEAD